MNDYYYDLAIQIWEDEGSAVFYSVIQNFSEEDDDHEVIAYGEADSKSDAARLAREAVFLVLE